MSLKPGWKVPVPPEETHFVVSYLIEGDKSGVTVIEGDTGMISPIFEKVSSLSALLPSGSRVATKSYTIKDGVWDCKIEVSTV